MTDKIIASPSVRARAAERGIDIEALAEQLGRVTIGLEDLDPSVGSSSKTQNLSAQNYWDVDHSAFGEVRTEPMSRLASLAADNLSASHQTIPSVTHQDKVDVSQVEKLRSKWKDDAQARGIKLTGLSFYVKALSCALSAFPNFNASLSADGQSVIYKDYVHIGIAVDTPYGLVVPVVRDADKKGIWEIASTIVDLAKRAQERKIRPEEMGGSSMTISSLGGIGGTGFTPIVNPPEVAILGLTRTQDELYLEGKKLRSRPMMPTSLSYDHRVINGAEAARFSRAFADYLEDPRRMLLAAKRVS